MSNWLAADTAIWENVAPKSEKFYYDKLMDMILPERDHEINKTFVKERAVMIKDKKSTINDFVSIIRESGYIHWLKPEYRNI